VVASTDVILATPDDFKTFAPRNPSVTVFLYHVAINAEMRNGPRRSQLNGGSARPPLPLELRFLITAWTKDPRDAYRITGRIARTLYDHTVLSFSELLGTGWAPDDTVELVMDSVPVDQLFDIWDPSEIPYKLSLTYLARIIGIDAAAGAPIAPVNIAKIQKAAS
jgi:hypothetical protein